MKRFNVIGMSCAACSARVEKAVAKVPGVSSVSVSLLTNSMGVEGGASSKDIIAAVEAAGYGASVIRREDAADAGMLETDEKQLRQRLISSIGFLLVLMYFSMGHMMFGWPVGPEEAVTAGGIGLLEMALAAVIMFINRKFFISGFRSLAHGAPNMDTLVAMGSGVSFLWSLYVLIKILTGANGAVSSSLMDPVNMESMHDLYFESAAMIVTLITVGKMLEARSKGKTTDALKSLMELAPKTAILITDGIEREVPVEEIKEGDMFAVRPGGRVPVDGIVTEGTSSVDESMLTGESIPVDKEAGCGVSAGTINIQGYMICRATKVGKDTGLAEIIRLVSEAQATKAPIAKTADKVSGIFVPVVIGIAIVTLVIWLITGAQVSWALERAIAVLVISCPCALGLATPVAIMVGSGIGAKNGILFKTAASLEEAGKADIVVMDKTGTITEGKPGMTDIVPADGFDEEGLLEIAAALEIRSEHPLARAITDALTEEKAARAREMKLEGFEAEAGHGLRAFADGEEIRGGNREYVIGESRGAAQTDGAEQMDAAADAYDRPVPGIEAEAEKFAAEGKTCIFFSKGGKLAGMIAVADVIKEDAARAVEELSRMGIRTVMLTGDSEVTARAIGVQAGTDEVIAGVLPDEKERAVSGLRKLGKVMMVGDGINDAPALARADIGAAIGAGTDVAIDTAEVVLASSRLRDVPAAIRLSRKTLKNIYENLFWAFFYNIIGIPLAAGVWVPVFGWTPGPMFAAAAMSLSSFCVVSNALRLNLADIYDPSKDRPKKNGAAVDLSGTDLRAITKQETEKETGSGFAGTDTGRYGEESNAKALNEGVCVCGEDKGDSKMKKTMKIEGMMCMHCEATVKKALEALDGVSAADVSHEEDRAVVTLDADVADDVLKKAVEDKDYEVISIE